MVHFLTTAIGHSRIRFMVTERVKQIPLEGTPVRVAKKKIRPLHTLHHNLFLKLHEFFNFSTRGEEAEVDAFKRRLRTIGKDEYTVTTYGHAEPVESTRRSNFVEAPDLPDKAGLLDIVRSSFRVAYVVRPKGVDTGIAVIVFSGALNLASQDDVAAVSTNYSPAPTPSLPYSWAREKVFTIGQVPNEMLSVVAKSYAKAQGDNF